MRLERLILTAIAVFGVAGATSLAGVQPALAQAPVGVSAYPSPGTISASPTTQISLRGRPRSELGRIVVME